MKLKVVTFLAVLFAASTVALLLLLVHYLEEWQQLKADVRLTRDVVWRIGAERDLALKCDVAQAVQYLQMFHEPADADTGFEKHLAAIISLQRKVAVRDVIAHLRGMINKDFGSDPEKWIEALSHQ